MDLNELKASFETVPVEDYKLTALFLREALYHMNRMNSRIKALEAQVATLEARLNDADAHTALMQHGMEFMGSELGSLTAMRDTLNAVFTIEAPAAVCPQCNGEGKWTDGIGTVRLCERCDGMGEVQP